MCVCEGKNDDYEKPIFFFHFISESWRDNDRIIPNPKQGKGNSSAHHKSLAATIAMTGGHFVEWHIIKNSNKSLRQKTF